MNPDNDEYRRAVNEILDWPVNWLETLLPKIQHELLDRAADKRVDTNSD